MLTKVNLDLDIIHMIWHRQEVESGRGEMVITFVACFMNWLCLFWNCTIWSSEMTIWELKIIHN